MKKIIITESTFKELIQKLTQDLKDKNFDGLKSLLGGDKNLNLKSDSDEESSFLKSLKKIFSSKDSSSSGDDDSNIEEFFKSLMGKGVEGPDNISFSPTSDDQIYKKILSGIGAPATKENMKFFYAWRQSEGAKATYNPFNTTQPYNNASKYNSVGVRNYKSESDGINATVKTLKNGRYDCIVDGLKNNIGAKKISTKCISQLKTWGTGGLIEKVLSGRSLNPPTIQKTFVKKV